MKWSRFFTKSVLNRPDGVMWKGAFRLFHTMFFSGVIGKAKKENLEVIGNIYANPELMEIER